MVTYRASGGDPRLTRLEIVNDIAQTPTGKLDKIALRAQFSR